MHLWILRSVNLFSIKFSTKLSDKRSFFFFFLPLNEINYLISQRLKILTLQSFHYVQSILSLLVCQEVCRSERMRVKSNHRSRESTLDRVIFDYTLLHNTYITCNIAQNWKSIVKKKLLVLHYATFSTRHVPLIERKGVIKTMTHCI